MSRILVNSEAYNVLARERTFSDRPQSELTVSGSAASNKRTYMALSQHKHLQVESKLYGSAGATTSGRPPAAALSPLSGDIVSSLYNQNLEIESLVQFRIDQLQSGLELLRTKHSRDLVSLVEQQATNLLRVKDMELEYVSERNRELEEHVRQLSSESLLWVNYVKTTEAIVSSLRAKLNQVINQNACNALDVEEGYGDSYEEPSPVYEAES